jgi:FkbM family methyltransferase
MERREGDIDSRRGKMLASIRLFATRTRHLPLLDLCDWLWNLLRPPYQALFKAAHGDIAVSMGGVRVRIPGEFAAFYWENYETEAFHQVVGWIRENPQGLVLDVGCADGAFSATALVASETASVVAFDSDLASLAATRRFCRYAKGDRLQTVYGFITDTSSIETQTLAGTVRQTDGFLRKMASCGNPRPRRYVNIATADDRDIPSNTLDSLLAGHPPRPILIKCDVEGAEMLVLEGSRMLLTSRHPALLLSIHPEMLPDYGYVKDDVSTFLRECGYAIDVIAIGHEEHWWCRKGTP